MDEDDGRKQAIYQRRNLLNAIRELEADAARLLRHAETLKRMVGEIENKYELKKGIVSSIDL